MKIDYGETLGMPVPPYEHVNIMIDDNVIDVTGWCEWKAQEKWTPNQVASFLVYCESTKQHPQDAELKIEEFERQLKKAPIVWRRPQEE